MDLATVAASPIVVELCCDSAVLLVSKKTIQDFGGGGGAGGGCCRDMFCVESPQADTRRSTPNRAEKLLSILSSVGWYAHRASTLRRAMPGAAASVAPGITTLSSLDIVPVLPGGRFVSSVLRKG